MWIEKYEADINKSIKMITTEPVDMHKQNKRG